MTGNPEIAKLAMIGCGSMGGGMAMLFAENGITVSLNDPSGETVDALIQQAKKEGFGDKLEKHLDYADLSKSLGSPKIFVFSLPHGSVGDSVCEGLHPYLDKGDIILDASNENWENTQRRQGKMVAQGVYYIGMGVSGGYQAARRGPSMCPGGEERALDIVMPLLQKVAAKDNKGRPCVSMAGVGGSGHYVKMIHNGIEHGMMSAISEAWQIMEKSIGMKYEDIGDVFAKWNSEGELRNTFLIKIAADICRTKDKDGKLVLASVQDKVVQDVDGSEGTGIWSNEEAIRLHVAAPTLSTAHSIRLASAYRGQREHVQATFGGEFSPENITFESASQKQEFLEDLRQAVYATCLAAYVQGMIIIDEADKENKWSINFSNVIQIWRAGCIIQADYIADMLDEIFSNSGKGGSKNLLYDHPVANDLKKSFPALRRIVAKGVEVNAIIPSLSATVEYLKYCNNLGKLIDLQRTASKIDETIDLPTQFYEAQLDYFGKHMFDLKSEPAGEPETGKHHYEWKPA
ncbi:MAG: hypothetical protein M1827_003794 [Pycnora praestabilis]|nr:MAG: hypothetical protein M1827_003794 [Pycnora praestabilis]